MKVNSLKVPRPLLSSAIPSFFLSFPYQESSEYGVFLAFVEYVCVLLKVYEEKKFRTEPLS